MMYCEDDALMLQITRHNLCRQVSVCLEADHLVCGVPLEGKGLLEDGVYTQFLITSIAVAASCSASDTYVCRLRIILI